MYFQLFYLLKRFFKKTYRFITKTSYFLKNILKVIVLGIIVYLFFKGGF